eukprot:CAMPEP_0201721826 /NCGR_PEP_ID=MMETSP0593-20130828/6393_1 /ASSEMBLY_ACC=CAM_ASM_000672 /TAXON_ID=267983 /ORGANISM="Skeletonema japonicum, Strain CCMP2506" /LENGTH=569 /DNA_ID=CAMNT_0048212701 /DNA_START=17 /DNA_END=1726 /DNA_ORIENTATION=+
MMKSLLTFLLLAVLSTAAAAASLEGNNGIGTASLISSNKNNEGRSNFRKLKNKHSPTYAPSAPDDGSDGDEDADADADKDAGVEELLVSTTGATPVTTTVSEETNNDKDTNDEDEEEVGLESTPPADNEAAPTGIAEDETTVTPPADTNNDDDEGCSFCEKGMPDLELIVKDAGGKTCAEVKETAMEQGLDNTCTKIIQPLEYVCCPVLEAGAAGDEDEETEKEVTTTTTTVTADVEGDEDNDGGDEEDNDGLKDEEVSTTTDATTSESVGGDANEFVKDQEGTTENTTTTAATSTAAATEPATSLDACVQSAQSAGQDDPLFLCCETHPDNAICALNKCMDFESQVITCQCQEVKGIANSIIDSNDPMAGYLPEDFDGFLGTFPKCCRSGQVSPKEFNDCSYEEFSEEIMEELEEEFGLQPTDKPTPRPSLVYIPLTDDEDPISSGQGESEDFSNGQKDDSLQGMINTYLDGVESPDEMKSDKNVQVVAISLVVVFLILLLVTAHLVMDYPDGLCASFCRLILKCLCCLVRVLCLPCRAICCKGSDQTRNRRTHAPMRAPFPSDLELA